MELFSTRSIEVHLLFDHLVQCAYCALLAPVCGARARSSRSYLEEIYVITPSNTKAQTKLLHWLCIGEVPSI